MLQILNRSIAVAANAHNPSLLHPAFLESQSIVPKDWELGAQPPVCTPHVSAVTYRNGVVIMVDGSRLQVIENEPTADPAASPLPAIVDRYVRTLPHIPYTGVDVNISGFVERSDADDVLRHFLATGPWNEGALRPESVGVRLVYRVLGTQLHIALDSGKVTQAPSLAERHGIVIAANYHVGVSPGLAPLNEVFEALQRFSACCEHFGQTVDTIVNVGASHAAR